MVAGGARATRDVEGPAQQAPHHKGEGTQRSCEAPSGGRDRQHDSADRRSPHLRPGSRRERAWTNMISQHETAAPLTAAFSARLARPPWTRPPIHLTRGGPR